MRAVLCPVCKGKGIVYGIAESGAFPTQTCYGCCGKGWVEISNLDDRFEPINNSGTSYLRGSHYGSYC